MCVRVHDCVCACLCVSFVGIGVCVSEEGRCAVNRQETPEVAVGKAIYTPTQWGDGYSISRSKETEGRGRCAINTLQLIDKERLQKQPVPLRASKDTRWPSTNLSCQACTDWCTSQHYSVDSVPPLLFQNIFFLQIYYPSCFSGFLLLLWPKVIRTMLQFTTSIWGTWSEKTGLCGDNSQVADPLPPPPSLGVFIFFFYRFLPFYKPLNGNKKQRKIWSGFGSDQRRF